MTHPVEPRAQHFVAALRADLLGSEEPLARDLAAMTMRALALGDAALSAEAVAGILIAAMGAVLDGSAPRNATALIDRARKMTAEEAAKILERTADLAKKPIGGAASDLKRLSPSRLRVKAFHRLRLPKSMEGAAGLHAPTPWDARHDGHLVLRRDAWRAGLVRYARALTPARSERITRAFFDAADATGLTGEELMKAGLAWEARRPIAVIAGVTTYTRKFVHDLWIADPSVAVVSTARTKENPFAPLGIPFVSDAHGVLAAMLAAEQLPALVEPRLGGFTVTSASGFVDFRGKVPEKPTLPAWARTMAEIGIILRHDGRDLMKAAEKLAPARRTEWLANFRSLMTSPLAPMRELEPGPERDEVLRCRAELAADRERMLALLEREEAAARAALAKSRRGSARRGASDKDRPS